MKNVYYFYLQSSFPPLHSPHAVKDTADNYVTEQNDIMNKMQEEMDKSTGHRKRYS